MFLVLIIAIVLLFPYSKAVATDKTEHIKGNYYTVVLYNPITKLFGVGINYQVNDNGEYVISKKQGGKTEFGTFLGAEFVQVGEISVFLSSDSNTSIKQSSIELFFHYIFKGEGTVVSVD